MWRAKTLDVEPLVKWAMVALIGVSKEGVSQLDTDVDDEGSMFQNQHVYFRDALAPGYNLNHITTTFLGYLQKRTEEITRQIGDGGEVEIQLFSWTRLLLGGASTDAFLGSAVLLKNPKLLEWLFEYERDQKTFLLGLPRWVMNRAHNTRDKIIEALAEFVNSKERLSFIQIREQQTFKRGVSQRDAAASIFTVWMA